MKQFIAGMTAGVILVGLSSAGAAPWKSKIPWNTPEPPWPEHVLVCCCPEHADTEREKDDLVCGYCPNGHTWCDVTPAGDIMDPSLPADASYRSMFDALHSDCCVATCLDPLANKAAVMACGGCK